MKNTFFHKVKVTINYLIKNKISDSRASSDKTLKIITSLIFAAASLLLTILNIVDFDNSKLVMTVSTSVLVFGFIVVALLAILLDKRSPVPTILMCVLVAFIFSLFILYGGNDGFACLWVLIVPPIAMNIIGLIPGSILTVYYQIFLFVVFYSPIKTMMPGASAQIYFNNFALRFPLLYLTIGVASFIFTCQKEYYFLMNDKMAHVDSLTDLNNRTYYEETRKKIELSHDLSSISIVSVDLNRLKYYNDVYGHEVGDQRLIATAKVIKQCFINADATCRVGGDEFIIISHQPFDVVDAQIASLREAAKQYKDGITDELTISVGLGRFDPVNANTFHLISNIADKAMYEDKRNFYERNHIDRRR